jgi:glycerophosphoryl diester phosphodiesterase
MIKKIFIVISISLLILLVFIILIFGGGFGRKNTIEKDLMQDSLILFAHRGVAQLKPENSKQSLDGAKGLGFKAVEIDIRQTKDDVFVLFHDVNCQRLLGRNINLSEINYDELKKFHLLFGEDKTKYHILSLEDFFREYADDFYVYLDTKTDGEKNKFEKADQLVQLIKQFNLLDKVIIANADFLFLAYLEYKYPEVLTALEGFSKKKVWIYNLIPKNFKTDYLSSSYKDLTDDEIDWLKENNMLSKRILYHVNSKIIDKFLRKGINMIIFDYDSSYKITF